MVVWYDFVVLALLVYTTWNGAQRGLVTQLAWIAALVLCFKFADKLAPVIEPQINVEQPLRHWIAMFVLYLGFSLGSFMVARILNSWMEKAKFKDFDRHLGGLLGLVKGGIIVLVATFFAVTLSDSLKATVLQSNTGYAACAILDNVKPITPEYFHEYLAKYREELGPIHNDHLGHASSIDELWEHSGESASGTGEAPDGAFSFPDVLNGLVNGTNSDHPDPADSADVATGPSIDDVLRTLPQQMRAQFGTQIRQYWAAATPKQKQNFIDDLGRSFDIPRVVSEFVSSVGGTPGRGGEPVGQGSFSELLNRIGDIYQNRPVIVARAREHLAGVPPQVQQAVVEDWYADLNLQPDPDPLTTVETRLDERIIRQLDKAGIAVRGLSFDLQQRLNQSLR